MTQLIEALSYPFVQRAIAAGVMISLCAALLGVILVLKQYSLIGHGLGDVGFASTSLAVALEADYFLIPIIPEYRIKHQKYTQAADNFLSLLAKCVLS